MCVRTCACVCVHMHVCVGGAQYTSQIFKESSIFFHATFRILTLNFVWKEHLPSHQGLLGLFAQALGEPVILRQA